MLTPSLKKGNIRQITLKCEFLELLKSFRDNFLSYDQGLLTFVKVIYLNGLVQLVNVTLNPLLFVE